MRILRNLFKGRLSRKNWLIGWLFAIVVYLTGMFLEKVVFDLHTPEGIITLIVLCLTLFFFVSINVRRLHDIGKSGWGGLIGMEGWWTDYFEEGQKKTNKYGKPPKPGVDIRNIFGLS
jgi:uncharacterized membrane protein YhaH (DUF805 family)